MGHYSIDSSRGTMFKIAIVVCLALLAAIPHGANNAFHHVAHQSAVHNLDSHAAELVRHQVLFHAGNGGNAAHHAAHFAAVYGKRSDRNGDMKSVYGKKYDRNGKFKMAMEMK